MSKDDRFNVTAHAYLEGERVEETVDIARWIVDGKEFATIKEQAEDYFYTAWDKAHFTITKIELIK